MKRLNLGMMLMIFSSATMAADCTNLNQLNWLLGHWQMDGPKTQVAEHWQQVSKASFEGQGITTSKNNSGKTTRESMRLLEMSGGVYFLAKVPNNPLPVAFAATDCNDNSVLFRNEAHDFPQFLAYKKAADGHLKVLVSSRNNPGFELDYQKQ